MGVITTAIGTAILGASASAGAITAVGATTLAIGTGLAVYGASQMMSPDTPDLPSVASVGNADPAQYQPSTTSASNVAEESIKNKRRAISRNRTIFTSPSGLTDEEKSGLTLKTLTGV
jgi:hypothetical protein